MKRTKALSIILITAIFIIGGLVWSMTGSPVAKAATVFPEGSSIGGVSVGGRTPEEALSIVVDEVERWKNESELRISVPGKQISIPYESIKFDIKK